MLDVVFFKSTYKMINIYGNKKHMQRKPDSILMLIIISINIFLKTITIQLTYINELSDANKLRALK